MQSWRRDRRACRCGRESWRWCPCSMTAAQGARSPRSKVDRNEIESDDDSVLRRFCVAGSRRRAQAADATLLRRLVVVNKSDNTASILEPKTGAARATVPVGKGPHEVEVLSRRRDRRSRRTTARAGSARADADAHRLATGSCRRDDRLRRGRATSRPEGALADGRLLVTAEGRRSCSSSIRRRRRVGEIPTGREVSHMVVASPDGTRAFVASIGSGTVTVADLAEAKDRKDIPPGRRRRGDRPHARRPGGLGHQPRGGHGLGRRREDA